MTSFHAVLLRTLALALVISIAAAGVALEHDNVGTTGLLVFLGAMTVGGVAPGGWWWLGALAGVGVSVSRLLAAGDVGDMTQRSHDLFGVSWAGFLAPLLLALAAAGVGANLRRFTVDNQDAD